MPVETLRPADSLLQRAPFSLRPADSVLQRAPFSLRPADSVLQRAPFSLRPADSLLQRAPFSLRPADSLLQRAPFSLRPADSLLQRAPFRLLHKGPQYLRQQSESSRLSAVERLEADKAKYVKSQQVALTRQAPIIRKALLPPALIRPAPGRLHSPTGHKVNPRQRHSCTKDGSPVKRGPALDLELLNNLINDVCDGACSPSGSQSGSSSSPSSGAQSVSNSVENRANDGHDVRIITRPQHRPNARSALRDSQNLTPLTPGTRPPPVPPRPTHTAVTVAPAAVGVASMAVRRVDVKPQTEVRTPRQKRPLKPALLPQAMPPSPPPYTPPLLLPASPAFTRLSNASSRGSARKHAALHRSKSDLSDRFSRANADLERFFNFCGLDPEEARALGTFTRANSDIVSGLHSASSASSEGEEEVRQPEEGQPRPSERVPYGISVIERNARVIKWLYGIRQAREGARESAREGAGESNV